MKESWKRRENKRYSQVKKGNRISYLFIKLDSNYVVCTANANGQFVTMQYVFRLTSRHSHLIAYDYNIQLITICILSH